MSKLDDYLKGACEVSRPGSGKVWRAADESDETH